MSAGDIRVAIIDDEPLIARALKAMLEAAGYAVPTMAHTHEEAVALVERPGACDIVFVDLRLGGKPAGIDVARRAVRNGLAVVVMTGGATIPDELTGVALLLKPFSSEAVRTLLHSLRRQDGPVAAA
ncbi:MAG: response regulator [Proteobacteria bacterium]|nr:response regulator [Pseudomonadota bacterium]